MYSRRVGDATAEFGVSGKLWHGVLVMFDRETQSLWTQLDGRAIEGENQGLRLEADYALPANNRLLSWCRE